MQIEKMALFNRAKHANDAYVNAVSKNADASTQEILLRVSKHYTDEILRNGFAAEYKEFCEVNYGR